MASQGAEDDLAASKTEGYKIGEKKTLDEYTKLGMSRRNYLVSSTSLQKNLLKY